MFLFEITQTTHTPLSTPSTALSREIQGKVYRKSVVVVAGSGSGGGAAAVLAFSTFF